MAELTDEQIEMIIETEEAVKFITYHYNRGRNDAIDEFAERMKNKLVLRYGNATVTEQYVAIQATDWCNEIAEQLKGVQE